MNSNEVQEIGSKRKSVDYSDIFDFGGSSTPPPAKKLATEGNVDGTAAKIAYHYNKIEEKGKSARLDSRIYYMRNFNNWIKSNLIAEFLEKVRTKSEAVSVLDLGCGKGGDLLKWKKGRISKLVGVDVADVSITQARDRFNMMRKQFPNDRDHHRDHERLFRAEFICMDCCTESVLSKMKEKSTRFDLTSCQFVYNYSFDSYSRAEAMLTNACRYLKVGGFFIGTMPNANEVMKRLKMSDSGDEFGNEVFNVKMKTPVNWPARRYASASENGDASGVVPIFGAEYNFSLEAVVDCPEYLVHFGTFKKMAEKHGMKLVYAKRFPDYAKQVLEFDQESRALMQRMNALESFPLCEGTEKLASAAADAYLHAEEHISAIQRKTAGPELPAVPETPESLQGDSQKNEEQQAQEQPQEEQPQKEQPQEEQQQQKQRKERKIRVGTLSKAEWEAVTLYMVFAFQKIHEPHYQTKAETKAETKSEIKVETKSETKPETKSETRTESS